MLWGRGPSQPQAAAHSVVLPSGLNFQEVPHPSYPTLPLLPVPGGLGQGHGTGALAGAAGASRP